VTIETHPTVDTAKTPREDREHGTGHAAPDTVSAARNTTGSATGSTGGSTTVGAGAVGPDEPAPTRGRTSIADVVVVKIAAMAAREVPGVYDMGGGFSRTPGRRTGPGAGRPAFRGARREGRGRHPTGRPGP
jgi:hypothetical protein